MLRRSRELTDVFHKALMYQRWGYDILLAAPMPSLIDPSGFTEYYMVKQVGRVST